METTFQQIDSKLSWTPCLCGRDISNDLIDAVYPCNRSCTVINAVCQTSSGGCGRVVYCFNDINALNTRWNGGVTDDNSESDEPEYCCIESVEQFTEKYRDTLSKLTIAYKLPLKVKFNPKAKIVCNKCKD
ncbi:hypothetical protein VCHA53O466_50139 [Vibrio chagasii]|nr:hypothetical protein VCHA53O466_50139 [Vibrio chagasii]